MKLPIGTIVYHQKFGEGVVVDFRCNLYDVTFPDGTFGCDPEYLTVKKNKNLKSKVMKPVRGGSQFSNFNVHPLVAVMDVLNNR